MFVGQLLERHNVFKNEQIFYSESRFLYLAKAGHVSITNLKHETNSDQRKLGKLSRAYLELVYRVV
jgi:hypothetical protein